MITHFNVEDNNLVAMHNNNGVLTKQNLGRVIGMDGHSPYIGTNNNWYYWDEGTKGYVDSGVQASGGSKIRVDYLGSSNFYKGSTKLNFDDLYRMHLTGGDFVFIIYNDRAYLCSFINYPAGNALKEMRFESVINSDNRTKVSSIYVISNDGIKIVNTTVSDINSENSSNKVSEITQSNVNDSTYPSTLAVERYVTPLKENFKSLDTAMKTFAKKEFPFIDKARLDSSGVLRHTTGGSVYFVPIPEESNKLTISNLGVLTNIRGALLSEYKSDEIVEGKVLPYFLRSLASAAPNQTVIYNIVPGTKYLAITTTGSIYDTFSDILADGKSVIFEPKYKVDVLSGRLDILMPSDSDINFYNNEVEITNMLVEARSHRSGNADNPSTNPDCITLLHCSDVHGYAANLLRVKEFYERHSQYIDDVIHTGDMVPSWSSDDVGFWKDANASNYMHTIGNHDSAISLDGTTDWSGYTEAQCFQKYFAEFIDKWGVTYTTGKCYYYKDYEGSKLRLVVIDCMHGTEEQKTWLTNVLTDAIAKDYHVILASHYGNGAVSNKALKFPTLGDSIINRCTFSDADMNAGGSNHVGAGAIIDDFINNGGKFVCWIRGHYHGCDFGYASAYSNQYELVAPTLSVARSPSTTERTIGTKSQDAFYLVTVDTTNNLLKVIMVGADKDKYNRSRKTMTFDYNNHVLLSNN